MLLGIAAGCGDGATRDPGLRAALRAAGAQFVEGSMPAPAGGPEVVSLEVTRNQVARGTIEFPVRGALGPTATGALLGLVGDPGHWILPAGPGDVASADFPTLSARIDVANDAPLGDATLRVQATDDRGRPGEPFTRTLTVVETEVPGGALVFTLSWDTNADLDLHVVDPSGTEIFARDVSSAGAPPPGSTEQPEPAGVLDFDSNSGCLIDGRRRENVVWGAAPPPGTYLARVDTFSLCGESSARWLVQVFVRGMLRARAQGRSTPLDTRFPHGRGAGLLALELELP